MSEIKNNLPVMLDAVAAFPDYQPVVAGAPGIDAAFYDRFIGGRRVTVLSGKTFRLLQQSRAALVTSGTATLETALLRVPQVVCYRANGSRLVYNLFKRILHVRFVSLVNLIADREVVRELLLQLCTAANVRRELASLLDDTPERQRMLEGYREMAARLGEPGAPQRAARLMVDSFRK